MLYLKAANLDDVNEEYKAIISIPEYENGFENIYYNVSKDKFKNEIIPKLIKNSQGIDLEDGFVPDTYYFLWDDFTIVGLFKIRHYLNDFLRENAGHISYGILPKYRGKKYGERGLKLAIDKCFEIIKEDEIYLSVHKDNPASVRMQLRNNAFIVSETKEEFITRIKSNKSKATFEYYDLQRTDWNVSKKIIIDDIINDLFIGKICLLNVKDLNENISLNSSNKIIPIKGYKYLMIAPKNFNWWLTVIIDENSNILESYFNITRVNCFSADIPYFVDMKLCVHITYNREAIVIGDKELKELLDMQMVTRDNYNDAYSLVNDIVSFYNSNKDKYYAFVHKKYIELFNNLI